MRVIGVEPEAVERIEAEVRRAAEEVGAMIIPTVLQVDAPLVAAVDAEKFPSLIRFLKPRLIYMSIVPFDAEEELVEQLDYDGNEDWLRPLPKADAFVRRWRRFDGQTCTVVLGLVAEGVLHGAVEHAFWAQSLPEAAQIVGNVLSEAEAKAQTSERDGLRKRIAGKVADLVADPRFSQGRVGRSKRVVLAKSLFLSLDVACCRFCGHEVKLI